MMDAKARLTEILDRRMEPTRPSLVAGLLADAVLAEFDLTPKPPQPAGPVTSASTLDAARDVLHAPMFTHPDMALKQRYDFDHKVAPKIAKDHGLLTPAEVERRAREWAKPYRGWMTWADALSDSLVAALTAPAATGTGVGK